jgi:GNAT superfamily N-acetyltransferase
VVTAQHQPQTTLSVGDGPDPDLSARLEQELTAFNTAATGDHYKRPFSIRVTDNHGALVAGLRGWTWDTCAGITLLWVSEDHRRQGCGERLLIAAESKAREHGCGQVIVSSFTFQAPDFYKRCGYLEACRTEGVPRRGSAEVHLFKCL